jgi:hypothetical protein
MHEIMGNTLGSLYTCPSRLLQRRRWKLGVTVVNFFMVKFWVAPCTYIIAKELISCNISTQEQYCTSHAY